MIWLLRILPFAAPVGIFVWSWRAYRRGVDSSREDTAVATSTKGTTLPASVMASLGWPYHWNMGTPATPWADGPKGVDCSGYAQMVLVKLGKLSASAPDRGARDLADGSAPIAVGGQDVGDMAYYGGHVMIVAGPPGADGHSPVIGASGGTAVDLGNNPNARVKLFSSGLYNGDFVTYMRLKP